MRERGWEDTIGSVGGGRFDIIGEKDNGK